MAVHMAQQTLVCILYSFSQSGRDGTARKNLLQIPWVIFMD